MADLKQWLFWIHADRLYSACKPVGARNYVQKRPGGTLIAPGCCLIIRLRIPEMPHGGRSCRIRAFKRLGDWSWDLGASQGWVVSKLSRTSRFSGDTRADLGMLEDSSSVLKLELLAVTNINIDFALERREKRVPPCKNVEIYYARPSTIPPRAGP